VWMAASDQALEAVVRSLEAEAAERIRHGESRAAVRASLVADDLPEAFIDGLLARIPVAQHLSLGAAAVNMLIVTVLAVLPPAGMIAGACVGYSFQTGEVCGMRAYTTLLLSGCAGLVGLGAGVGMALAIMRGLWAVSDAADSDQ
jgi:hypothetical protein